jgi:LCP family protein required for cell wall assembly
MQSQTRNRRSATDQSTKSVNGVSPQRSATVPTTGLYGSKATTGKTSVGKPRKRRDPLWAKLTVVFGAVLMMASGGAIVGAKVLIAQATGGITQTNLLGEANTTKTGGKALSGPINMLLLGVDARARWAVNDTRADTIIILHIPASHDQAYLISIPRDTDAQIPAFSKSRYAGGQDKINSAFFFGAQNGGGWQGGAQLMAATIKNMTGITFNGAAIIDFNGFKGVIDALGTVRLCVDQPVTSHHMTLVNGKPMWNADAKKASGVKKAVTYKPGCREMQGWEALDYSRQRYGLKNGDYDRQRHQQQLLKAMAKKATESGIITNLPKLSKVIQAAGKAFVLDTNGVSIEDFIFTLKGVAANDLVMLRTNDGTFSGDEEGREALKPISHQMFEAAKGDGLAQFILNNPTVVATEK